MQHALQFLDRIGFDEEMATAACAYLVTITTSEGGVPWILPSAMKYPRADWLQTEDNPPASLNPTGAIVAVLHKNHFQHQWLGNAIGHLFSSGLVADPNAEGYVRKPLDWAGTPDHPLRKHFKQVDIDANLDVVIAGQQDDGGWNISWKPISPTCELEWRGWVTISTLRTLQANGRFPDQPL